MFTGIIEELGTVAEFDLRRLIVRCSTVLEDAREGSSIAVNGVCLTAIDLTRDSFAADLAPETLARTNLGDLRTGSRVNLERPVTPVTRLSGHLVQGHIDGTAEVLALDELADGNWWLKLRVPAAFERYLVHKGSVAIDGISFTIAALNGDLAEFTIIPHTYEKTTLGSRRAGERVNVEVDVLAKHVEKLLKASVS
jgi:riboflavin synthase